jgi:hypothetical protein
MGNGIGPQGVTINPSMSTAETLKSKPDLSPCEFKKLMEVGAITTGIAIGILTGSFWVIGVALAGVGVCELKGRLITVEKKSSRDNKFSESELREIGPITATSKRVQITNSDFNKIKEKNNKFKRIFKNVQKSKVKIMLSSISSILLRGDKGEKLEELKTKDITESFQKEFEMAVNRATIRGLAIKQVEIDDEWIIDEPIAESI